MKLYYSPMASSLIPHIVLIEAGATYELEAVDLRTKKTASGANFLEINPKGYVPALEVELGEVLTEVSAIVQYIAERYPEAGLLPEGLLARAHVREWLNFTAMELHKNFSPFFNPMSTDEQKARAASEIRYRLKSVERALAGRETLVSSFSVADIYLGMVLSWAQYTSVDLSEFPNVVAFRDRVASRPSVAQAMKESTRA